MKLAVFSHCAIDTITIDNYNYEQIGGPACYCGITARQFKFDVDLFTMAAGKKAEIYFHIIGGVISATVLFALSWRLWVHADRLALHGAVTNSLTLPFAPVGYFAAISCGLSGVVVLIRLANIWRAR